MNREVMSREEVVLSALSLVAHTNLIDPQFVEQCLAKLAERQNNGAPGFGSMLEQNEHEFSQLLEHVKGCRSALEIGSRYGESIKRIAKNLEPVSRVVAVDLPYTGGYGDLPDAGPILHQSMSEIYRSGHDTHLFVGNSRDPQIVAAVQALGPFEFIFIDGDHSYEGVKADWENYGPLATKVVAFHDIVNNVGCFKLWNEIKAAGYRTTEYTSSIWLGIGVVFKDNKGV